MWDEILNGLGFVFGTPGKMVRSGMVGENPFQYSWGDYWYGRDQSPSGRDMLERWGVLGENVPGLDFGDILGGVASLGTDPWSILPIGRAAGAGMAARGLGGGLRGAAKPAAITGGVMAGFEGLNHWLQPKNGSRPNSPQLNDMHTAALLEMMLREPEYDEDV